MRMPGISGIDVLRKLREQRVDSAFIVMTGFGTVDTAVEAMKLGAVDFVQKPFFRDELLMRVRVGGRSAPARAAGRSAAAADARRRRRSTRSSARATAMQQGQGRSSRAPRPRPGTVLITGETGTGKELVGARDPRAAARAPRRAFVALNCAALTDSLLENELFGHARGAFTGAAARARRAHRARARRHALPRRDRDDAGGAAGQAAARARIGRGAPHRRERAPASVDVRFVAATNIDLQAAVDAGAFRSDLFYRLNVHRIHLPPLRERGGDVARCCWITSSSGSAPRRGVDRRAATTRARRCSAYTIPGNVRQLEHIIQRAVAIARGAELEPADLPEELFARRRRPGVAGAPRASVAAARERAEREMIVATLARHRGEIAAAARELQVSRTTLWRLMKKHQIAADARLGVTHRLIQI